MSAQVLDLGRKVQLANSQPNDRGRLRDSAINDYVLEADPELHREVEIDLPRDLSTAGRSQKTMSRKSTQSKKSETPLDASLIVKSRGRPIKPHETEPFLSINNLPPEKTFLSEKSHGTSAAQSRLSHKGHANLKSSSSVPLQRLAAYMSPYSQAMPNAPSPSIASGPFSRPRSSHSNGDPKVKQNPGGFKIGSQPGSNMGSHPGSRPGSRPGSKSGNRGSRTGRMTPNNTPFQSPVKRINAPNHHVKSPFKHSVTKPDMVPDGRITPGMELKEKTALATYHVNRMMAVNTEKEQPRASGNLMKGKLKPLYPVNVSGPDIAQCRGIISETRSYAASPSRTLQRRLNLVTKIPNVHEFLYDRPRTVESVHQTSVASSVDDNRDNLDIEDDDDQFDSNRSLPDEILYTTPMTRSATMRSYTQDPIITAGNTINQIPTSEEDTPRFITEVDKDMDDDEGNIAEMVARQMQEIGFDPQGMAEVNKENQNMNNNIPTQLADITTEEEQVNKSGEMDTRDAANRLRSPSKSVRFAVDPNSTENIKDVGKGANDQKGRSKSPESKKSKLSKGDSEEEKKQKTNNKQSCKPDSDLSKQGSKDDDNDDDNDQNDKNRSLPRENSNSNLSAGKGGRTSGNGDNSSSSTDTKDTKGKTSESKDAAEQKRRVQGSERRIRSAEGNKRGQHCSRIDRAQSGPVSLQVQSVLHGDKIYNMLGSTSPGRSPSRSRSVSPTRRFCFEDKDGKTVENVDSKCTAYVEHCQNTDSSKLAEFQFFNKTKYDKLYSDYSEEADYEYFSQRSRVKFQLEGEEPQRETIFIEKDHEGDVTVELREDKPLTFETIESELESLQMSIKDKLIAKTVNNGPDLFVQEVEQEVVTGLSPLNTHSQQETERSACKTESSETIQGEYSDLLGQYRLRCMERSENIGAFSETLATPRTKFLWRRDFSQMSVGETISEADDRQPLSDEKKKMADLRQGDISDSGQGSEVDNCSEISRPSSTATLVPRLDLSEGSFSDLGLGTERSDVLEEGDKNLLEMVCDELSPMQKDKKMKETKKQTLRRLMRPIRVEREEDVSKLKVVATTKSLSKSKVQKKLGPSLPAAPFPPLCFNINAKPPKGFLYVFAYGPEMNSDRFNTYVHRKVEERFWAVLFGFSLNFNKKGLSAEAGGFANVEFNPLRSVEGCLYQITEGELELLDQCIGYPKHYERVVLPVWMSNSKDPDTYGVAQYCVPALLYVAQDVWTETEKTLNCDYSVSQCLKSDMITPEYRTALTNMTSTPVQVAA